MSSLTNFLSNKRNVLGIIGFIILAISVPMILLFTRQRQEIRQRASGEQTNLFFAQTGTTTPLSSLSVNPGATVSLELYLNANSLPISGFDLIISGGSGLTISQISPAADASKFNAQVFSNIVSQNNTVRYSKVSSDPSSVNTGLLHLATVTFTAASTGADNITFPNALITSEVNAKALTVSLPSLPYAIVSGQTITPSSTLSPTSGVTLSPTSSISPTTGVTVTPTFSPSPTSGITVSPTGNISPSPITPSPSPTIPFGATSFSLTIGLHGIGTAGDNLNPNSQGNLSPNHPTRNVAITLFDLQNNQLAPIQGQINFNSSLGLFVGTVSAQNIPTGNYQLKVQTDGFLIKQLPTILTVTSGQTIIVPPLMLVNGDINNDDKVDVLDYALLINCYGDKQNSSSCTTPPTQQSAGSDINDDGVIDGFDYNLFVRELASQNGQ